MTYLFAVLAVGLSLLLLRGRNVSWVHWVWILLPIDMYGIAIAGFTLKPWMLFMAVVVVWLFAKRDVSTALPSRGRLVALTLLFAGLLATDVLNGMVLASVMQHMMFIVVCAFAFAYLLAVDVRKDISCALEACAAAAIGYSVVYIASWIMLSVGYTEVLAHSRMDPGLILLQGNVLEEGYVESARLRGFLIDPNTLGCTLVVGYTYALSQIARAEVRLNKRLVRYYAVIILSISSIWLCNSRTCALVFFALAALAVLRACSKKRSIAVACLLVVALLVFLALGSGFDTLFGLLDASYGNRASISSDSGRLAIWQKSFDALISNAPFVGLGENQVQFYSGMGLACHNTWLEWLCGNGLIVGSAGALFFLSPGIMRFSYKDSGGTAGSLRVSYLAMVVMLFFVDNFTNSNLIFVGFVLMALQNKEEGVIGLGS